MSASTPAIEQLPEPIRTKLRSSQILTSFPQVVSELLQNSLDAGASQVDIGVDCELWECWVKDNGAGMTKQGLSVLAKGSEAGRYNSSKVYNSASLDSVSTFGFRGEALASAADISCIEISTRTTRSKESWAIILKSGQKLYEGPAVRWRRETAGTTVCLRDVFYNLPIRRRSHPSPDRTMDLIKREIETYALVFPQVSFSLEDVHKSRQAGLDKGRVMTVPKTPSILSSFRHIHGRALAQHVEEIDVPEDELRLCGFISLEGAHSKLYQYLYVNHHPLAPCHFHGIIDNNFGASTFGKHAFDEEGETSQPRSSQRRSPRKTEREPVYVLDLIVPPQLLDNCLEPGKTAVWFLSNDAVSSFVDRTVRSFLVRHGFLTGAPEPLKGNTPSPRKRRKLNEKTSPFRRQRSYPIATHIPAHNNTLPNFSMSRPASAPLFIRQNSEKVDSLGEQSQIIWTDPDTRTTYVVDPRTGNSYPRDSAPGREDDNSQEGNRPSAKPSGRRTLVDTARLKRSQDPGNLNLIDEDTTPQWILNALKANQTYTSTERTIPSVPLNLPREIPAADAGPSQASRRGERSRFFDACASTGHEENLVGRFGREDLRRAKVISQLDRKFIVCTIDEPGDEPSDSESNSDEHCAPSMRPSSRRRALVLIDQHAASERVRVERFLKELCLGFLHSSPDLAHRAEVEPPKPVLLTQKEVQMLHTNSDLSSIFQRWGFDFMSPAEAASHDPGGSSDSMYEQVFVKSVPMVVKEKILMGNELAELFKSFIASFVSDGLPGLASASTIREQDDPFWWQKALRWCPRELLDLVNSRACRGAIMFNDTLGLDQCERLIRQLSETALPFQCAHGRPSLAPLANTAFEGARKQRGYKVDWEHFARK